MTKGVWICFDLGIRGDYEGLYRWLDGLDAIECGENLAYFRYEPRKDLVTEIKASLKKAVEIGPRTRIYLIHKLDDKVKGKFIFGRRKAPPWTGFAPKAKGEDESAG